MAHLIDKAAIENILRNLWQTDNGQNSEHRICYNKALQEVQYKLDTLEVKEVDLEAELKHLIGNVGQCDRNLARHFFELGLKAQKGEEV